MTNEEIIKSTIENSIKVKQTLLDNKICDIEKCAEIITEAVRSDRMIFFAGNGGSAADAQHLAAELIIRFRGSVSRRAIKAMSLSTDPSVMTAGGNDLGFENIYSREMEALAREGDLLVAISTSGNSKNIVNAILEAKKHGTKIIGLLGCGGGEILQHCDAAVVVEADVTARIQESHIMIGHIWCDLLERNLWPEKF